MGILSGIGLTDFYFRIQNHDRAALGNFVSVNIVFQSQVFPVITENSSVGTVVNSVVQDIYTGPKKHYAIIPV